MRALIVTPHSPYPAQQGAALRNLGILHSLAQSGARVTLLTFCEAIPDQPPDRLAKLCERIVYVPIPPRPMADRLRDLALTSSPDLARRLYSEAFVAQLTALLREQTFDLVQFEGLEVAVYLPFVRAAQPQAVIVYDAHNAEFALQNSMAQVEGLSMWRLPAALYSQTQVRRIARFERSICEQAAGVIAVSQEDAAHLGQLGIKTPVHVLPNGIFTEEYAAAENGLELTGIPIVFTGKMDYRPNVDAIQWFTEAIFPAIRARHSDASLYVVGQAVHNKLLTLQEADPAVAFTGWVESVKPFLHHARVFVAPLRMGSGTRLKILEAMAAGCAIVATTVAASGLDGASQGALMIADKASDFSAAVNHLITDSSARQKLSATARQFVRDRYDWSVLAPQLQQIYMELGVE